MSVTEITPITSPHGPAMDRLCDFLQQRVGRWQQPSDWPGESLQACAQAAVYRWFLPRPPAAEQSGGGQHAGQAADTGDTRAAGRQLGGFGWSEADQTRGYLRLAEVDLTTTFIITQYMGACRRIAGSDNRAVAQRWLEPLLAGDQFSTVGISHLTTSRQSSGQPAVLATPSDTHRGGYRLSGTVPWVTGAKHADVLVLAATLEDGRQLLAAVPATADGVVCGPGFDLVALSASCTDRVQLHDVEITADDLIAGPMFEVMKSGVGAGTGGLQTSTLAIGLASAAAGFLHDQAQQRPELQASCDALHQQLDQARNHLLAAAAGNACDLGQLRGEANSLALRMTQAAMTAGKGRSFIASHPVGRWCREALFFLVWSCPQPVASAHLCELAGVNLDGD